MASGSQYINGSWALLVIAANKIKRAKQVGLFIDAGHRDQEFQCPWDSIKVMAPNSRQSPIRLVRAVTIPLFNASLVG